MIPHFLRHFGRMLLLTTMLPIGAAVAAPPSNDAFASPADLGSLATVSTTGTTLEATRETGEPVYVHSNQSVWFRWTAPAAGWKKLVVTSTETAISNQPAVAVFSGDSMESLTLSCTDPPGGTQARFPAEAAKVYFFHVTELGGAGGFSISLANSPAPAPPANDHFSSAAVLAPALPRRVSGTFLDATVEPGEPNAYPPAGLSTVWYRWTAPAATPWVDVYLASGPASTGLRLYTGSTLAGLTELLPRYLDAGYPEAFYQVTGGTAYYLQVSQNSGAGQSFSLNLETLPAPAPAAHNTFSGRVSLGNAATASRAGDNNAEATTEPGEPLPVPTLTSTLWYSWTAPASGAVEIKTLGGANHDTFLCAYSGSTLASLALLAYNDDIDSGNGDYDSRVILPTTAGVTYQIQVGSAYGAWDSYNLTINPVDPDLLPFRILAFTASAATLDLTANPATVTFEVTLSDLPEFDNDLFLTVELPATTAPWGGRQPQRFLEDSAPPVLVSGTTYRFTRTFPAGLPPGSYPLLVDVAFQSSGFADGIPAYGGRDGTTLPGGLSALTITNSGTVTAAPRLTSFTMIPATVDTSLTDAVVQISAAATGLPTTSGIQLLLTGPPGTASPFDPGVLTHDGTSWTASMVVPKGSLPRVYRPTLTLTGPALGRDYGVANPLAAPLPAGSTGSLIVTNAQPDCLPPQLRSFTFDTSSVNLAAGDAVITGTCRLTDASDLSSFSLGIDDGTQTLYPGFFQSRLSGTPQDGIYQWTLLIRHLTPASGYEVVLSAGDRAGNFMDFSPVFASYPAGLPSLLTISNGSPDPAEVRWMALQDFSAITGNAAVTATGINADPDFDSIPSFLEFYFGTDPADPANASGAGNLPVLSRNGPQLRLDFGQSASNAALGPAGSSLKGQHSLDLNGWSEVPVTATTPGFYRIESPASAAGKGYLRLKASPRP